jgi:hypothetical protein
MYLALETIQEKVAYNFNTKSDASSIRIKIRIVKGIHGFILDLLQGNVKKSYYVDQMAIDSLKVPYASLRTKDISPRVAFALTALII